MAAWQIPKGDPGRVGNRRRDEHHRVADELHDPAAVLVAARFHAVRSKRASAAACSVRVSCSAHAVDPTRSTKLTAMRSMACASMASVEAARRRVSARCSRITPAATTGISSSAPVAAARATSTSVENCGSASNVNRSSAARDAVPTRRR